MNSRPAASSSSYTRPKRESFFNEPSSTTAIGSMNLGQYHRHCASMTAAPLRGGAGVPQPVLASRPQLPARSNSWAPDSPSKKDHGSVSFAAHLGVSTAKAGSKGASISDSGPGGIRWLVRLLLSPFRRHFERRPAKYQKRELLCWMVLAILVVVGYKFFSDGSFSAILTLASAFQCFALAVLTLKVVQQKSVSGISQKTLILECFCLISRLGSTLFYNGYLPVDRSGDWVYQFSDILTLFFIFNLFIYSKINYLNSIQKEKDTFPLAAPVLVAFVLACLLHPKLNQSFFADVAWTFALYLETIAMLPQLFMMGKLGGEVEALTSHFVASMAASKVFACLFWSFSFGELAPRTGGKNFAGWAVIGSYVLQTILFADFFYYYLRSMRVGKRFLVLLLTKAQCQILKSGMIASFLKMNALNIPHDTTNGVVNQIPASIVFGSGALPSNDWIRLVADSLRGGLSIDSSVGEIINFNSNSKDGPSIKAKALHIDNALSLTNSLSIGGIPQWLVVHNEDFSSLKAIGWDNKNPDIITQCAGINMLGGYGKFAKGEIAKKLTNLRPHEQIRIKANFHFIDNWGGETAFMRLNIGKDGSMVFVWTDTHTQSSDANGVNVCGSPLISEGKFTVPIDIIVPHSANSLTIGFGSTIETDDPMDQSWGISSFQVLLR